MHYISLVVRVTFYTLFLFIFSLLIILAADAALARPYSAHIAGAVGAPSVIHTRQAEPIGHAGARGRGAGGRRAAVGRARGRGRRGACICASSSSSSGGAAQSLPRQRYRGLATAAIAASSCAGAMEPNRGLGDGGTDRWAVGVPPWLL